MAMSRVESGQSPLKVGDKPPAYACNHAHTHPSQAVKIFQACQKAALQALADSDFVVEAIKEDEAVKKTAFSLLDNVCIALLISA